MNTHIKRYFGLGIAIIGIISLTAASSTKSKNQTPKTTFAITQEARNSAKAEPQSKQKLLAAALEELPITLRPGTDHRSDSKPTAQSETRCKAIVYETLSALPEKHRAQLKELTLFHTRDGRRGLGGNNAVVLRCLNVSDKELSGVLIHEIGHLVDGSALTGNDVSAASGFYDFDDPVGLDDPSLIFYKISWISEKKKKRASTDLDFVSLYAKTDPFEDFAETYAYYRLHGPEFRKLRKTSAAIEEKYEFMKKYVFDGKEFGLEASTPYINMWKRKYDVTVLPFATL